MSSVRTHSFRRSVPVVLVVLLSTSSPLVVDASRPATTTTTTAATATTTATAINPFHNRPAFVPRTSRTAVAAPGRGRRIRSSRCSYRRHGDAGASLRSGPATATVGIPRGGQGPGYDGDDGDDDEGYYYGRGGRYASSPSRPTSDRRYDDDGGGDYPPYRGEYNQDDRHDDDNDGYDGKEYYYDDRGGRPSSRKDGPGAGGAATSFADRLPAIIRTGNRQIGLPLLGVGAVLTVLGMSLFFNKALMRLGNLFFVAGVPMTLGPGRTAGYFFQPKKARATACLALGLLLVFVGWPILGLALEAFGLLNLFGNMFPVALAIMKQMPIVGPLLKGDFGGGSGGGGGSNRRRSYDDYYDDRPPTPDDSTYQDRDRYYDEPSSGFYGDDRADDNVQGYY